MNDDPRDSNEPDQEDQLAALRANIDQMVALAPEQARAAFGLYSAYMEAGFTADQAFQVVMANVYAWLSGEG